MPIIDFHAVSTDAVKSVQYSVQSPPIEQTKVVVVGGIEYSSPKLDTAIEWLRNNPDKIGLSVRRLADAINAETDIGISKSWASVAKNYWLENREAK